MFGTSEAAVEGVIAHWSTLVENFSIPPKSFYALVESSAAKRRIPDLTVSRVDWHEGGVLSARREYLRFRRDRLVVDVCTAPFGTGCFFSSWTAQIKASLAPLFYLLAISFVCWLLPVLV